MRLSEVRKAVAGACAAVVAGTTALAAQGIVSGTAAHLVVGVAGAVATAAAAFAAIYKAPPNALPPGPGAQRIDDGKHATL